MARLLSEDLRSRLIGAVQAGMSRRTAAKRFGVGVASAIRWVSAWHTTGAMRALPQGGDRRSQRIEAYRGIIEMLWTEHGASFASSTIWRFLDRHDMTVKKTAHAGEQERPDIAARREAWFDAQPDLDPERLIAAAPCGDNVAATPCRTATGKPSRSQALCASGG